MGPVRIRVSPAPDGADRGYDILIHDGALDELPEEIRRLRGTTSAFVITDSNVGRIYAARVRESLSGIVGRVRVVTFRAGESNKSIHTAWALASKLNGLGADRDSVLLALGGGVVGDLTGFVASIYKRGVDYVQLPTTLLAQVDSSIGGKTGVDAPWGKNQLGTFHQPRTVLTDPLTLKTLPEAEMLNGFAEVVKCSVVADEGMFERLSHLSNPGAGVPVDIIARACEIKAGIVSKDVREANLRSVLNFGHTVGHALEAASRYRLSHGCCVVFGMLAEGWVALHLGILQKDDFGTLEDFLVPLSASFQRPKALDKRRLVNLALSDKKASGSTMRMSLPSAMGEMHTTESGSYLVPVTREDFTASIDYLSGVLGLG